MLGFHSISEQPISTISYIVVQIEQPGGSHHKIIRHDRYDESLKDADDRKRKIMMSNNEILVIIKSFLVCH